MSTRVNQYGPDCVSPPGVTIEELMLVSGLKLSELAVKLGLPLGRAVRLTSGEMPLTSDIAQKLAGIFNVPAEFWVRRELIYREYLLRKAVREAVPCGKEKSVEPRNLRGMR